jgi:hypothetical protein
VGCYRRLPAPTRGVIAYGFSVIAYGFSVIPYGFPLVPDGARILPYGSAVAPTCGEGEEVALAMGEPAPVGAEDEGGEGVGGDDEAPVVRRHASASSSAARTRARRATK